MCFCKITPCLQNCYEHKSQVKQNCIWPPFKDQSQVTDNTDTQRDSTVLWKQSCPLSALSQTQSVGKMLSFLPPPHLSWCSYIELYCSLPPRHLEKNQCCLTAFTCLAKPSQYFKVTISSLLRLLNLWFACREASEINLQNGDKRKKMKKSIYITFLHNTKHGGQLTLAEMYCHCSHTKKPLIFVGSRLVGFFSSLHSAGKDTCQRDFLFPKAVTS